MTRARELAARRRAALAVCGSVPRVEAHQLLDMLGLIPLDVPKSRGNPLYDTGFDGGRRAWLRSQRARSNRAEVSR